MREMKPHPQRLAVPAAPGTLLKRFGEAATRLRLKQIADHDPVHLAHVRQLPCLKCGMEPAGEAAHIRKQSAAHGKRGGMARKPADRFAVPLCAGCHRLDRDSLHRSGEAMFFYRLGLDPLWVCEQLYRTRGDAVAMRAAALAAIAERTLA
jgi:hypothetical protein